MADQFDLIIIGSGPGGYVAAIRAAQLGLQVGLIEKDKPGGVCLNMGCIPSKALIHQAELYRYIPDLEALGIAVDSTGFDYQKVLKKSRQAADTLSKGVAFLIKKNNIAFIQGKAQITGEHEVTVDGQTKLEAKNIIIASGSRPRSIPGFEFDEQNILSSDGALLMTSLPKSMLILGGGAIGCEFAHILNAFGVQVTLVEMLDRILPTMEKDTADVLAKSFSKRGITIITGSKAVGYSKKSNELLVVLEDPTGKTRELTAEKVLVVVGRQPNIENISQIKLETEQGFIKVKDYYQTNIPSVFAIGDVTSSPLLAHVASKEGEIAVEYLAGGKPTPRLEADLIPLAVYTEPQVAGLGLTEDEAKARKLKYRTASFPYRGSGKAVAVNKTAGLVKIITDEATSEILGAHIAGAEATELLHEILLAKATELLPFDLAHLVHAHPTLAETVMEAMRASEGWAIHI